MWAEGRGERTAQAAGRRQEAGSRTQEARRRERGARSQEPGARSQEPGGKEARRQEGGVLAVRGTCLRLRPCPHRRPPLAVAPWPTQLVPRTCRQCRPRTCAFAPRRAAPRPPPRLTHAQRCRPASRLSSAGFLLPTADPRVPALLWRQLLGCGCPRCLRGAHRVFGKESSARQKFWRLSAKVTEISGVFEQ